MAKSAAARVGMPGWLLLNVWADLVQDAFGETPYLVGSATRRKTWRDVDVRLILADDLYAAAFPLRRGHTHPHPTPVGTAWSAVAMAFSALGRQLTGLPIDFQVQSQAQANREPGAAARIPLGMRFAPPSDDHKGADKGASLDEQEESERE